MRTEITQDVFGIARPSRIFTSGVGGGYDSGGYFYDGVGNIKQVGQDTYAYDGLGRVTRSSVFALGALQVKSYSYDRWGNKDEALNNPLNRLGVAAAYDSRGNLTGKGTNWYGYDALSRQTTFNGGQERYLYDGAGERVARLAGTTAGAKLFTVAPCRVMDTRDPSGPYGPALQAGTVRDFTVVGRCGVPANALAIVGNLTAALPSGPGHFSLFPAGAFSQTSTLNYNPGVTRANNFRVRLSGSGAVGVATSTTTHGILDVTGYYSYPGPQWTLTFRDEGNRVSTDYFVNPSGRPRLKDYFYFGNLLVATRDGAANYLYYASDHLGTPRLTTNQTPQAVEGYSYYAFGEEICCGFGNQPVKFAAMERDASSLKDYVHARYFGSSEGRFLSPDKVGGRVGDPQTWYRYAYARNNTLKYVDPDGNEFARPPGSETTEQEDLDQVLAAQALARGDDLCNECSGGQKFLPERFLQSSALGPENFLGSFAALGFKAVAGGVGRTVVTDNARGAIGGQITGFTKEVINQAITRGIKPAHILDSVKNPLRAPTTKLGFS